MNYFKSLFFNFLVVFFANHILPGIAITDQTKLPHVGSDLMISAGLGFLNSLIYPFLKFAKQPITAPRIGVVALALNLVSYLILKFAPLGVMITSIQGYFMGVIFVTLGSFLTNFLQMRRDTPKLPPKTPIS